MFTTPGSDPDPHPAPITMQISEPADFVAAAPVMLGFEPHKSIVLLTFGGEVPFHARVDMPPSYHYTLDVVELLTEPCRRNPADGAAVLFYSDEIDLISLLWGVLHRSLLEIGVEVVEALRVSGDRYYPLPMPGRLVGADHPGVRFDIDDHRFRAQAVVAGKVLRSSREAVDASLEPDAEAVAAVAGHLPALGPAAVDLAEGEWVEQVVRDGLTARAAPSSARTARLALAISEQPGADAAWAQLHRAGGSDAVDFWTDVVRRTPAELRVGPLAQLAWAAWVAGDGALAWCGLDRAAELDADHWMLPGLTRLLEDAVPPTEWPGRFDWRTRGGEVAAMFGS